MSHPDFYDIATYDYNLPEEQIAQCPVDPRDHCRMMVLHKATGNVEHKHFYDILSYLRPGDLLVRNDTRVMAARLSGIKVGGGARCEILLLRPASSDELSWEALVRPGRKLKEGVQVRLDEDTVATMGGTVSEDGVRIVFFPENCDVRALADREGAMPLPPYIHERTSRPEDYQTVYSKKANSAAAPTAGLHFTAGLLEKVRDMGVNIADVTLEVGLGTFRPVSVDDIRQHPMHTERCTVPVETYKAICETKQRGGRVIAVGTTVVRTLEGMAATSGGLHPGMLDTNIFIYPGYEFKVVDALITNFHLPKSTLVMLVSAFAGYDFTMSAYKEAVETKYRFFSFGDSMMIV